MGGGGSESLFKSNSTLNLWFTFITSSVAMLIVWNPQEGLQLLHLVCELHPQMYTECHCHTHKEKYEKKSLDSWHSHLKKMHTLLFISHINTLTYIKEIPLFCPTKLGQGSKAEQKYKRLKAEHGQDEKCWLFSLSILSLADGNLIKSLVVNVRRIEMYKNDEANGHQTLHIVNMYP